LRCPSITVRIHGSIRIRCRKHAKICAVALNNPNNRVPEGEAAFGISHLPAKISSLALFSSRF
jgi:hypothetical protein